MLRKANLKENYIKQSFSWVFHSDGWLLVILYWFYACCDMGIVSSNLILWCCCDHAFDDVLYCRIVDNVFKSNASKNQTHFCQCAWSKWLWTQPKGHILRLKVKSVIGTRRPSCAVCWLKVDDSFPVNGFLEALVSPGSLLSSQLCSLSKVIVRIAPPTAWFSLGHKGCLSTELRWTPDSLCVQNTVLCSWCEMVNSLRQKPWI